MPRRMPLAAVLIWLELIASGTGYDMQVQFAGMRRLFEAIGADASLNPNAVSEHRSATRPSTI